MKASIKEKTPEQRAEISSARERLEKLKASKGNTVRVVQIGGEDWFIREMNCVDLLMLGMLSGGKEAGNIDRNTMIQLSIEALQRSICVSKTDVAPYFTKAELQEYMDLPQAALLMSKLVEAVVYVNPGIFPKKKAPDQE